MGVVGDHTYSTIRTPYSSAAAEVSAQKYALEEVPELFQYLFYNLAPIWKDYCVSLCSVDYGGGWFFGFLFLFFSVGKPKHSCLNLWKTGCCISLSWLIRH